VLHSAAVKLTIHEGRVDWRTKGIWHPGPSISDQEFAAARHGLFSGAFTWPLMVARRSALDHNIAELAAFCAARNLEFAPHGKTTMAPALFEAQLNAGAWGITVATAGQALACRAFGVPRVLLANELLDPSALAWLARQLDQGWELLLFVDSTAGVRAASGAAGTRPVRVLAELGYPGGRTGCRDAGQLLAVARSAAAAPGVELAGVAGYEGGIATVSEVSRYLSAVRSAVTELADARLLPEEVIVTAGGSAYFDLVAAELGGAWLPGHQLRVILRSGAYVSHDNGLYQVKTPFNRIPGALEAALEIWAQITSVPERGLALAGMGKREAPFDAGLPVPLRIRHGDGRVTAADGLTVTELNDHHAFLLVPDGTRLAPGDLICFGISHPCTAFDKWPVIPVIDDSHTVTDLIRTYF
jgi:D-serine deaminase-like pyridoxal phosphate-dependent protein